MLAAQQQSARPDSSGLISRLGQDTIAVERVVTAGDSITGEVLDRYPQTERFAYTAHVTAGHRVSAYTLLLYRTPDPASAVALRMHIDFVGDSARVTIQRRDGTSTSTVAVPQGTVPLNEPAFGLYQVAAARALAARGRRLDFAGLYGAHDLYPGSELARVGNDTVLLATKSDTVRVVVDERGHVRSMTDPGGTLQATVVRAIWPDLTQWTASFLARDAQGKALGPLSPRETTRAVVGGAHLAFDYGRPAKRGRAIFGAVVPWNRVWRTGANAATSFVTDQDVMLGTTRVPAGSYTLFSVPARDGWTLIVSRKTGEWGTEYDSTADFARIPMRTATTSRPVERFTIAVQPAPSGGQAVTFAWDTLVGSIAVRSARSAGS
jgi:DUF2911 family protein